MNPALIIIDAQNEYFAPHGKSILPDGEQALAHIQELLQAFRTNNQPIFHVVHERLEADAAVFRRGSIGAEIHPAITVQTSEEIVTKHVPGAFYQTPLEMYLRAANIDTLVISGYMTHMCCDTTTRQASARGFKVLFSSDATATRDILLDGKKLSHQSVHETTLGIMTGFATVLTSAEIIKQTAPDQGINV
ncbi:MAG TPA: cysteine hydrolase family protein [Dictyobacter sp.]|jgi:nicotinamidase-related amidase|nr:cysteine hydrolase family protein [Dictyobacter sp.]